MFTKALQVLLISCSIIVFPIFGRSGAPIDGKTPCAADEVLQTKLQQNPNLQESRERIEAHWRQNPNYGGHGGNRRRLQGLPTPLEIPINFHIISDISIGYEQIISQIRVLNLDFMRDNSDVTQGEFANDVGDYNMKFSLNNIYRVASSSSFGTDDKMKFTASGGSNAITPKYVLNFWVCNINGGILGYAQFPGDDWDTDGVVIDHEYFGSKAYDHRSTGVDWQFGSTYDLGRTATHEVGHWLNLRHIWGDGDCAWDDQVADTPVDDGPNYGCPNSPNSCGTNDMYMNFMDYTNDNCMNMFTSGQLDRSDDLFLANGFREDMVDYYHHPTDITFVSYFYFVNGNGAACDVGHTRRSLDLNQGAGGDYIYLCVAYSNNPYMDVITDVHVITGGSGSISCPSGYIKIDSDLNEDAGGDSIYACFKKESQATYPTTIITDLHTFSFSYSYSGSYDGYTLEPQDLNSASGGSWIYLGYKKVHSLYKISFGEVKTGIIGSYEKRYFQVTLSESEPLYFETCGSAYDTYLYWYNSDLNQIIACDDCGYHGTYCGTRGDLVVNANAGVYYVAVGGWSSSYGTFQLSMAQGALTCGASVTGDVVPWGKDYYRVDLSTGYSQIVIEACNSGTTYDSYLYLYDSDMNEMNRCDDCNSHGTYCGNKGDLTQNSINAGTYYVGVGGWFSSSGNYEVSLTCTGAGSAHAVDNAIINNKPGEDSTKPKHFPLPINRKGEDNNNPNYLAFELSNSNMNFLLITVVVAVCLLLACNVIMCVRYFKHKDVVAYKSLQVMDSDSEAQPIVN